MVWAGSILVQSRLRLQFDELMPWGGKSVRFPNFYAFPHPFDNFDNCTYHICEVWG